MVRLQRLPMGNRDNINVYCIVYSPNKYRETEGIKDLFNKSHSVAYAVLCLQTAYLKAHYPVYFYKALLNINKDDNGKINKFIVDAQNFGVKILPPSINHSEQGFSVYNNSVLFGIQAIRGIGENLANEIINERNKNGKFKNLDDLLSRVKLSEAQVVALIKSGAIPCKDKERMMMKLADKNYKVSAYKDVVSLPSKYKLEEMGIDCDIYKTKEERLKLYNNIRKQKFDKEQEIKYNKHISNFKDKYLADKEMWEFETLSIFLNNNPFAKIYDKLRNFEDIEDRDNCVLVGVISKVTKKKDKNKRQFAYLIMYSAMGIIEITCWANQYSKFQDIIKKDSKLAILCNKKDGKAFVSDIKTYDQWLKSVNLEDL